LNWENHANSIIFHLLKIIYFKSLKKITISKCKNITGEGIQKFLSLKSELTKFCVAENPFSVNGKKSFLKNKILLFPLIKTNQQKIYNFVKDLKASMFLFAMNSQMNS